MKWHYVATLKEYQLAYDKSLLARIQMVPRKKRGFWVKTLISGIYFGESRQKQLERKKQEWVAYKKKFADQAAAEAYLKRKMAAVTRFIRAREKEV